MEILKSALQFVGNFWWLWIVLSGACVAIGLWQMNHTPQDTLRARGYHVSAVVPLYLLLGLFDLSMTVLTFQAFG